MSTGAVKRWVAPGIAGGATVLVVLALFAAFVRVKPVPIPASPTVAPVKPQITLAASIPAEDLFSFQPLFLPTEYNTSVLSLPANARREPGVTAETVPAKLNHSFDSAGGVPVPELFPPPARLVDVLTFGTPPNPWPEVGRADIPVTVLPPRLAYVEVVQAKSGKVVLAESVPTSPDQKTPPGEWPPLEFMVAIDAAGLVGAPISIPITTDSPPADEVESFFREFLAKKFQLGAKIAPGFYTVRIGP